MTRRGGRKENEIRTILVNYEGLIRVDGSARFGFGETQSLASISGPIEVRPNSESPSQATLEVHIRPLASVPGTDSRALAATLKSILTPALLLSQHPRTLVQIVGQALCGTESGGGSGSVGRGWHASLVASLVNACSAALISASSVPMRGIICAVAVGRITDPHSPSSSPTLILDPSETELPLLSGGGCFAFLFSSTLAGVPSVHNDAPPNHLLWTNYTASCGAFSDSELLQARKVAEAGAVHVWRSLKDSLMNVERSRHFSRSVLQDVTDINEIDYEKMEI